MRSRASIYDLLSERPRPTQPSHEAPEILRFRSDYIVVEDAWLRCGSGDIHRVMASDGPPFFCDFIHDPRIRDNDGRYLGVSRIEGGGVVALSPRDRACQLLEQTLENLLATQSDSDRQTSRVILQTPFGVPGDDWLDDVLMRWPIDQQPTHGIEVTSLPFDAWMSEELSVETGKTENLQFIAVAPLCIPTSSTLSTPGEAVVCLWLRRPREDEPRTDGDPLEAAEVPSATLKLMSPTRACHEARHEAARGATHLLEAAIEPPGDGDESVTAIVWDGDRSGVRLDHMISMFQQRFPHLYLDTDLWSVQGVGGSVQHASTAVQAALATHLARKRQGDILLLDSREEERTLAMWLHHEAISSPIEHG